MSSTIVPPIIVGNEATASIGDDDSMGADDAVYLIFNDGGYPNAKESRVYVEALASMVTRPIVPPVAFVVANEATTFVGDAASMGDNDDVHLIGDGRYPNAKASEATTDALVSLKQPRVGAPPLPDADEGLHGDD